MDSTEQQEGKSSTERAQTGTRKTSELKHITAGFPPSLRAEGKRTTCFLCGGPLNGEAIPICSGCDASIKSEEAERIAREAEERVEAERRRVANIHSELADLAFSIEHCRATLAEHSGDVRGVVSSFMEKPETARGLLICGPVGTGKTHLLAAICREYLVRRSSVEFWLARAFFRRIWSTYQDKARETEQEVIEELSSCDLLAIDDLGHEGRVSDASLGALHEVISCRHGDFKPTIITTNLTLGQIAERYDASIASRLGAWARLILDGEDRRA